ncbi:MAG TPA: hypothetical protein VIO84_00370 [Candidatus Dormibacteraeota bacterium]|jgi:hypothetical protein
MKRFSIAVLAVSLALLTGTAAQADSSGGGTQKFGPFASTSPDGGTCAPWANDTFDRSFSVHDNGDGTFKVSEYFRDGTFTTTGPASPGSCETSNHHGSTVKPGIVGDFQGYLSGTVTSSTFDPQGCAGGVQCATLAGFLLAVFGPAETFTCNLGYAGCDFNFEYHSSDQSLEYHHWQDKSDNHGGEQFIGDIANE